MIDFEAAYFALFQAVASRQGAGGGPLWACLTAHAVGDQVAPHGGVGRHEVVTVLQDDSQIVDMQLHGPAGVFPILGRQRFNRLGREAVKAADIVAQAVAQGGDGIPGTFGGVIPAFQVETPKRMSRSVVG